jgi:hypothetical protein
LDFIKGFMLCLDQEFSSSIENIVLREECFNFRRKRDKIGLNDYTLSSKHDESDDSIIEIDLNHSD